MYQGHEHANQGIATVADDEAVGITDVDCTPRPRYREAPDAFAARMARVGLEADGQTRRLATRNRTTALRNPEAGVYFTLCACHFRSLRASDPEVAMREYDAHACTVLSGDEIHRDYRGPVDKRPASAMVEARSRVADAAPVTTTQTDDTEQRMALLELK